MAAPGPRKRSGPALCGAGWARGPAPAAPLGNGVPPHKRPKGPAAGGEAPEDPFGDGDDFTADELEEIETIASQALSRDAGRNWGGRGRAAGLEPAGRCEGERGDGAALGGASPRLASPHGPPGSFRSRERRGQRAAEGRVPLPGAAGTARRDPAQGGPQGAALPPGGAAWERAAGRGDAGKCGRAAGRLRQLKHHISAGLCKYCTRMFFQSLVKLHAETTTRGSLRFFSLFFKMPR